MGRRGEGGEPASAQPNAPSVQEQKGIASVFSALSSLLGITNVMLSSALQSIVSTQYFMGICLGTVVFQLM